MVNKGKLFEQNMRKSLPKSDKIFYYRLKDSASSYYGGNANLRFSQNNIADAFLFYVGEYNTMLFILEYKNHKGKSLPLSCIKKNQIDGMIEANKKECVIPMLVVFFEDLEKCYSLDIEELEKFINTNERKSIPLEYFQEHGIEIETIKLRTNYKYNIEKWLNNI